MKSLELAVRQAAGRRAPSRHTSAAMSPGTAPFTAPAAARWLGLLAGLMLLTLLAMPAWADPADPPGRVGRLSELNGQVWVFAPESNEWIAASRNRPVTSGDRLSTEADGRAEIRVGSSIVRVDANTELEVIKLDDNTMSFELHSGSASARLRTREAADEFSLVTSEGRFHTERTGSYRFDRIDDTTHGTVWSGQALFEGDGTALTLQNGQRAEFWKDNRSPNTQYSVTDPKRDAFSDWVASSDQREERSVSARYVSPEMTGVEDLDRYGRWEQTPDYGAVWTPRVVDPGWAPYRMGHWAWVGPWGWTWVDDAPWGFAPFHYGRWVYRRNNWCWSPGTYVARPVYAPALVAWVGGSHANVSVSIGSAPTVGWFPLGPREVYVPGYQVSPRYVRNVNVTHVTNITNVTNIINNPSQVVRDTRYVNRGIPRAVTVVPSTVMERRQPVGPAAGLVNDRTLRDIGRERARFDAPVPTPHAGNAGLGGGENRGWRGARDPRNVQGGGDDRFGRGGVTPNSLAEVPPSPRTIREWNGRTGPGGVAVTQPPGQGTAPRDGFGRGDGVPRERREPGRDGFGRPLPLPPVNVAAPPVNHALPGQPPVQQQPPPQQPWIGERRPVSPPDVEHISPSPGQRAIVRGGANGGAMQPGFSQPVPNQQSPQPPRAGLPRENGGSWNNNNGNGNVEQEAPRMRHHEMPGPPRNAMQAPQPQAPQPQMAPPPAVVQPQRPPPQIQVPQPPPPPRAAPDFRPRSEVPREAPREPPREGGREGAPRPREGGRGGEFR